MKFRLIKDNDLLYTWYAKDENGFYVIGSYSMTKRGLIRYLKKYVRNSRKKEKYVEEIEL